MDRKQKILIAAALLLSFILLCTVLYSAFLYRIQNRQNAALRLLIRDFANVTNQLNHAMSITNVVSETKPSDVAPSPQMNLVLVPGMGTFLDLRRRYVLILDGLEFRTGDICTYGTIFHITDGRAYVLSPDSAVTILRPSNMPASAPSDGGIFDGPQEEVAL